MQKITDVKLLAEYCMLGGVYYDRFVSNCCLQLMMKAIRCSDNFKRQVVLKAGDVGG